MERRVKTSVGGSTTKARSELGREGEQEVRGAPGGSSTRPLFGGMPHNSRSAVSPDNHVTGTLRLAWPVGRLYCSSTTKHFPNQLHQIVIEFCWPLETSPKVRRKLAPLSARTCSDRSAVHDPSPPFSSSFHQASILPSSQTGEQVDAPQSPRAGYAREDGSAAPPNACGCSLLWPSVSTQFALFAPS